jgi:hypothetical protein
VVEALADVSNDRFVQVHIAQASGKPSAVCVSVAKPASQARAA